MEEKKVTIKVWPKLSHTFNPHQLCKYNSGKIRTPFHKFCHQKLAHWNSATEKSTHPKMFCHYTKWSNQQFRQIPELESVIRIELTLKMMIISSMPAQNSIHNKINHPISFFWATHFEHWWSCCEPSESFAFFGLFSVFFWLSNVRDACCCCWSSDVATIAPTIGLD